MIEIQDLEQCNVCQKVDRPEDMIIEIRDILECSQETIEQWEDNNRNIDLYGWFCHSCATKHITEIEESDNEI